MQQQKFLEWYNEYTISSKDPGDDPEERVPLLYFDAFLLGNSKESEIKYSVYRYRLSFSPHYGDHHTSLVLRFGLFNFRPTIYIRLFKAYTLTEEDIESYIRIRDARRKGRTSLRS